MAANQTLEAMETDEDFYIITYTPCDFKNYHLSAQEDNKHDIQITTNRRRFSSVGIAAQS